VREAAGSWLYRTQPARQPIPTTKQQPAHSAGARAWACPPSWWAEAHLGASLQKLQLNLQHKGEKKHKKEAQSSRGTWRLRFTLP
jgi:hypothetical protein